MIIVGNMMLVYSPGCVWLCDSRGAHNHIEKERAVVHLSSWLK